MSVSTLDTHRDLMHHDSRQYWQTQQHQAHSRVCLERLGRLRRESHIGDTLDRKDSMLSPERNTRRLKRQRHQHNVGYDGFLATDRAGESLCRGWQEGKCFNSCARGWCPRVANTAHQCAKCLSGPRGVACQRARALAPRGLKRFLGKCCARLLRPLLRGVLSVTRVVLMVACSFGGQYHVASLACSRGPIPISSSGGLV